MARSWRTVRVFISSTFRDMHAERDHLIKAVFPELREILEPHRIHLVDIDLRWGVTAEQADNDRVLDLCLDEIKKSRPFFIGILGQRYGWVPGKLPEAAAKKFSWLQGMPGRSITELEILHGVLNDPKMRMHSMFYFRKDDFLAAVPKEIQDRVYLDGQGEKLKSVKEAIRRHCQNYGAPLREYPCAWDPDKPNPEDATKGRITGLDEFGQLVKNDLLAALSREYPELTQEAPAAARPGTEDWLAEEADFHERFIEARLQVYVGRDKVHCQLMDYLQGDATCPLLLSGGSGTGKSSILGRLREEWSKDHPDDFILPHFIGASPSSTDIRLTLRRLCLAIKERFKLADEVPDRIEKLPEAFGKSLQAVPEGSRAVLLIDAVNQLDEYGGGHDMTWLPDELPPRVKIVVSCIVEPEKEQATLRALRARNTQELRVEPLADEERFEIVAQVPSISAKSLDPRQVALLLDNPATTNPLYLTVALEELRGFGSFEKLNERIKSFPRTEGEKGLVELFLQVLARLESELGAGTVYSALASIATSRYGLSEKELSEFLNRIKLGQEGPVDRAGQMLLALRQLRPYLLRRGPYVDFYHRNLYKAVRERYLSREDVRQGIHHALAEYFNQKGLESGRMLSETAHHMREAGMWDGLDRLLADLAFVSAKCAAGMTYELVEDYASVLEALPEAREESRKRDEHQKRIEKYTRDLMAYSKGETTTLEIIPSVRPWTDEEIEADSGKILKNPSRLDRIRAFSQFANSESHALSEFGSIPGFCIQHAYNCADSGPVGRAAEVLVSSETDKAMLLHAPFHRLRYNPHPALLRTLWGHAAEVHFVSIMPDGKRAVSASRDNTLRVWDLESGRCLKTVEGIEGSFSVTPDGGRAASASRDNTLRLWDLQSGRCLRTLEVRHTDPIYRGSAVSITPDGRKAISAGPDRTLQLWDLDAGRCLRTLEAVDGAFRDVTVTADGKRAAAASYNTLQLWDLEAGRCLGTLDGFIPIGSFSVTPDGKRAVCGSVVVPHEGRKEAPGSSDFALELWDLEAGRSLGTLEGHSGDVRSVGITSDGKRAISASTDKTLRLWDLETGRCLRTLEGHTGGVASVSVTPDGKRAVSGSSDNTLRLWNLESGRCLRTFEGHAGEVESVKVVPDGRRAVSAADKTLRVWSLETGRCLGTLEGHEYAIESVSVTPDGKRAISGSDDATLRLWDLESGRCLRTFAGHMREIRSVSVTSDGTRAVSGSWDKTVRVWNLESGRCLGTFEGHAGDVLRVRVTPDGRKAVSGSVDNSLRVWDLENGRCLFALEGHTDIVLGVNVTLDGKRVLSASRDKTLRVWDLENGRLLRTLEGHTSDVRTISITPEGRRAISASWDGTLRLWDFESGRCLRTLAGYAGGDVRVTPDGRKAVSAGWHNTLRLWDLESGRCVAVYQSVATIIKSPFVKENVSVTANGVLVAAAGNALAILALRNIHMEIPLISSARLWLHSEGEDAGRWEAEIKAVCPWCGGRFPVPAGMLELIGSITRKAGLKPEQSPCAELQPQAWDEPGLVSACALCRKPLKFNPFVVDEKGGEG